MTDTGFIAVARLLHPGFVIVRVRILINGDSLPAAVVSLVGDGLVALRIIVLIDGNHPL